MKLVEWLLTRWLVNDIAGVEPRIVTLEAPIQLVGLSMRTDQRTLRKDMASLGRRYLSLKQQHEIPNRREPWAVVGVRTDFTPATGAFRYLVGDVVTSLEQVPAVMVGFEIPAATYAVFPVRPKNRIGWGLAIAAAKRYAFDDWLPRSPYRAGGAVNDFEYHDERCTRKRDPEIDLYVAVTRREGS